MSARIGYADPPYPGQSAKHYADHADYAGEVDHRQLLKLFPGSGAVTRAWDSWCQAVNAA